MQKRYSRRRVLAGTGAVAAGTLAGCGTIVTLSTVQRRIDRTVAIGDAATAAVTNPLGDITVTADDRSDVLIEGEKRAGSQAELDDLTVETDREDGRLTISARDGDESLVGRRWLDLRVTVPTSLSLARAEATQGDVQVTGCRGGPDAATEQGDVVLRDVQGDCSAESSQGDVTVQTVAGAVTASTKQGDVTASAVEGIVGATSRQGDVTVVETGGVERATTDQGDVVAEVTTLAGDATVRTRQGDVTARLASDLDATVTAETTTGEVTVTGLPLRGTEQRVTGTLGAGTHDLTVRSTSGDVTLRESTA